MKPSTRSLCALCLTLLSSVAAFGADQPGSAPVLAQNLNALTSPGKVDAVLWTRRVDGLTLQVVLSRPPRGVSLLTISAWLLRADGTRIDPERTIPARPCEQYPRCAGSEALFWFPASVRAEAIEAALSVNDVVYTNRLEKFAGE